MPSTVTLFMIVKNEAKIIERCLCSLRPHIDYVVITDTGSSDDTVQIIRSFLQTHQIPGRVYTSTFENFGKSRSQSFLNMQDWLDEQKIDKSNNYGLTVDADMCLQVVKDDYRERLSIHTQWLLKQKTTTLEYWNSRLFRSDLPFECVGVTHEYWRCNDKTNQDRSRQNHDLYISDVGDGGSKADKFERDIRLLSKGLEDEPKNERYMFYLANSLKDFGKHTEAVDMYKRRIAAGGWFEEVFMAWMNMAACYEHLQQYEHAVDAWLQAYNYLPRRAEPLYKLARHFRIQGKNHLSLLFIQRGLKVPFPTDLMLFVETPVYKYLFVDEVSINCFYTNMKQEGMLACQYLMMAPDIPDHTRKQAQSNNYYYLRKLSAVQRIHQVLDIPVREPYVTSSASLSYDEINNRFSGVVRAVNYSMDDKFNYTARDVHNVIRTINYWCEFDANGRVIHCEELTYILELQTKPLHHVNVRGLEDMRVCACPNRECDTRYAIAVDREYTRYSHPSIVLCHISVSDKKITRRIPITYHDDTTQKNWTIFDREGEVMLCYSHYPFTLLRLDPETGETVVVCEKYSETWDLRDIRGSANPVKLSSGEWLFLTHEVAWKDTRKYFHRFLRYTDDWELVGVSEPFYFNNLYVEFSLSMCLTSAGQLVIPFSTKDNSTELLTIALESICWLPADIPKTLMQSLAC